MHAGNVGNGKAAAVAGALAHGGDLDLLIPRLQIGETELQRCRYAFAADSELPLLNVDPLLRNSGQMVAHEKCIIRRDRRREIGGRRFEIRRARGQLDQRTLTRQGLQHGGIVIALRKTEGEGRPFGGGSAAGQNRRCGDRAAQALQKPSALPGCLRHISVHHS